MTPVKYNQPVFYVDKNGRKWRGNLEFPDFETHDLDKEKLVTVRYLFTQSGGTMRGRTWMERKRVHPSQIELRDP